MDRHSSDVVLVYTAGRTVPPFPLPYTALERNVTGRELEGWGKGGQNSCFESLSV